MCEHAEKSNTPSSQYCHRPGAEAGGFAGGGAQLHNEASARACSRVFTEAVSEVTVIIKDLRNSIHFPSGFREPLLSTRLFMRSAGCMLHPSTGQEPTPQRCGWRRSQFSAQPTGLVMAVWPVAQISLCCDGSPSVDMEKGERQSGLKCRGNRSWSSMKRSSANKIWFYAV